MTFVIFIVGLAFGATAHEVGHYLVAIALGVPVKEVRIGIGPSILRRDLGGTILDVRLVPFEGFILPFTPVAPTRFVLVAVSLGGVIGNAALIALVAIIAARSNAKVTDLVGPGIVWAQVFMISGALLPYKFPDAVTDGLRIVIAVLRPESFVDAATRVYAASMVPYAGVCGLPRFSRHGSVIMRNMAALSDPLSRGPAVRSLLRCLALEDVSAPEKMVVIDRLVTHQLMHRDIGIDAQLDELTQLALRLGPGVETLRGSRGAALVELGRNAEGKALLEPLAAAPPSFDSVVSQAFLARAEHRLGCRDEARRLLELARAGMGAFPHEELRLCVARTEAVLRAETACSTDPAVSQRQ